MRRAVVGFAVEHGATSDTSEDIELAVSEAVANSVLHGYRGAVRAGFFALRAAVRQGSLEVVICDQFSAGDFVAGPWPVKYRNAVKLAA